MNSLQLRKKRRSSADSRLALEETRNKALEFAVITLDRCLSSYCLDSHEHNDIISAAVTQFAQNDDNSVNLAELPVVSKTNRVVRQNYRLVTLNTNTNTGDGNNEYCEICERDGNLLCCDSCTLVFHLSCLRPKLDNIPKGSWSCPFCIVDRLAPGDVEHAKKSIYRMQRLCHGIEGEADSDGENVLEGFVARLGSVRNDHSISFATNRYITRKKEKSGFVETGRYWNLKDALQSLQALTSVSTSAASKAESKVLNCIYCLDNENISTCAFCGCQACFTKLSFAPTATCSSCQSEYHVMCVANPSQYITKTWRCPSCGPKEGRVSENFSNSDPLVAATDASSGSASKLLGSSRKPTGSHAGDPIVLLNSETISSPAGPGRSKESRPHGKRPRLSRNNSDMDAATSSDAAAKVVNLAACLELADLSSKRPLTARELTILSEFRRSAPVEELIQVKQLLIHQREALAARLAQAKMKLEGAEAQHSSEISPVEVISIS